MLSTAPNIIIDIRRTNTMDFLYDEIGKRKYVTNDERRAFLCEARQFEPNIYTFCATLAYTGARISEVLALTPERFDYNSGIVVIECLKKRRRGIFRAVPIPSSLLGNLDAIHDLRAQQQSTYARGQRIWPWGRTTAWKRVKQAMVAAGISGAHATPKALRHGFGVTALQQDVPISAVQKWLGHSRLSTTTIYTNAVGEEERAIASQLWHAFE